MMIRTPDPNPSVSVLHSRESGGFTFSTNQPAEEPLLLWPMVIFLTWPRLGASMVNLSSVPLSKLFLSLSSRLSPLKKDKHQIIRTVNKTKVTSCKDSPHCKCGVMFCVSLRTRLVSPYTRVFLLLFVLSYYVSNCFHCRMWQTCVAIFPKNINEDVSICSTAFNISREHTHNIFIICKKNTHTIKFKHKSRWEDH